MASRLFLCIRAICSFTPNGTFDYLATDVLGEGLRETVQGSGHVLHGGRVVKNASPLVADRVRDLFVQPMDAEELVAERTVAPPGERAICRNGVTAPAL